MTDLSRYPRTVFWSDEDEGFIAVAPDLPGSSAWGQTREEALAELDTAMLGWIEAARVAGNPVPRPSTREDYSGRVLLRMPKSLHRGLAETAKREGVSLNLQIVADLEAAQATRTAVGGRGAKWDGASAVPTESPSVPEGRRVARR